MCTDYTSPHTINESLKFHNKLNIDDQKTNVYNCTSLFFLFLFIILPSLNKYEVVTANYTTCNQLLCSKVLPFAIIDLTCLFNY